MSSPLKLENKGWYLLIGLAVAARTLGLLEEHEEWFIEKFGT